MNIFDKRRIKRKIHRICKVIEQLPEADQTECRDKIIYCLRNTDDRKKKEHFLDLVIERFGAICQ